MERTNFPLLRRSTVYGCQSLAQLFGTIPDFNHCVKATKQTKCPKPKQEKTDSKPKMTVKEKRRKLKLEKQRRSAGQCKLCDKSFPSRHYMLKHLADDHKDASKPWKCDKCEEAFNHKSLLKLHNQKVHEKDSYKHFCSICGKGFQNGSWAALHEEKVHSKGEDLKFNCDQCGISIVGRKSYNIHMKRTHGQISSGTIYSESLIIS